MIERIIEWSATHRWTVFGGAIALLVWSLDAMRKTPLDAIPDLSDPQVIVFTEWMGRSPDLVEDQITYPLVKALQSTPGSTSIRGYSMFGMSFIHAIFEDGVDIYWARTRVLEQLGRITTLLPDGVSPVLGPDASGVGWIYQYVLVDETGKQDVATLRALQDFTIRPALLGITGVAEVASLGGFERQYQIVIDPYRLSALGVSLADIQRAVRDANTEVGARVIEQAGREYILRGRGYVRSLADLERSVVAVGAGGKPLLLGDVAHVRTGPEIRRGAADWNGTGEATGAIVVMRLGANALEVIDELKREIDRLVLPPGVRIVPTYDRSMLIRDAVATLRTTLIEEGIVVFIICLVFLMHARSALVVMIILPLAVLSSFIAMRYLGLTANIMSLGGIAIAIGELTDAAIVLIENAHVRLARAPAGSDRNRIIIDACKEVGRPIFFSLLLITVSFMPIFTLAEQAGRLFSPLAWTKTAAMFAAAVLSITLAPPLMMLLLRGRIRTEEGNPVNRWMRRVYRPMVERVVRFRRTVVMLSVMIVVATIPPMLDLGSEFMPPLDEGSLLVMPTTFPGISIEEARRALIQQDRIIAGFPEVASVHGKAGRAETSTDPAQLDMNEIVVALRPRTEWPATPVRRWYSDAAPAWLEPLLQTVWPESRARTIDELATALERELRMPGYQMSIAPPIRTRIDMLTTGVRTPVGIKVLGADLAVIEGLSLNLEGILRNVPGTRSTFAERQSGREYIDITPDRDAIARFGLTVRDVLDVVETAVGGMPLSTVIDGRARYSVNLRFAADYRSDVEALRMLPVQVPSTGDVALPDSAGDRGSIDALPMSRGGAMSMSMGNSMSSMPSSPATTVAPAAVSMNTDTGPTDVQGQYRQSVAVVPLSSLADVRVVSGPPMIKDENGVLAGYVFADIDTASRDLGGWVGDAKATVSKSLDIPPGYRLVWTGQYEFMSEMQERMKVVLPATLVLIIALLYLSLRGFAQTLLVLTSVPFAITGSIWLLWALDYNISTAVWVGLIAVGGVAAQTGIVVIVYMERACREWESQGLPNTVEDIDAAIVTGALTSLRPMVMTVATTVFGLMPLLWESGTGADLSARTAAPVIGGLWACMFLTLLVLPAAYAMWRKPSIKAAPPA